MPPFLLFDVIADKVHIILPSTFNEQMPSVKAVYIYSEGYNFWLWVLDMMSLLWFYLEQRVSILKLLIVSFRYDVFIMII